MDVQNNKVPVQAGRETSTRLGIQNTRNRLELLYPGRFDLHVKDTEQAFIIQLSIQLHL
jgi:LytS/YehU family sensor histidine kinase